VKTSTPSLPKRFPGECVVRFKLWTKKRSVYELEGPADQRVAVACLALMARKLREEDVAKLETLMSELGLAKKVSKP
jgi:hypothetical protein